MLSISTNFSDLILMCKNEIIIYIHAGKKRYFLAWFKYIIDPWATY